MADQVPDRSNAEVEKLLKKGFGDMDHSIKAMSTAFSALGEVLKKAFQEVAGALQILKQLPDLVRELKELVATQFKDLFTRQMEAQTLLRTANLMVANKRLGAVRSLEQAKLNQLGPDCDRVLKRYQSLLDKVALEASSRVRKLDSHAFEIIEKAYPEKVAERFSYDPHALIERLFQEGIPIAKQRSAELKSELDEAQGLVQKFLGARRTAVESLIPFEYQGSLTQGSYSIPMFVVAVMDSATGQVSSHPYVEFDGRLQALDQLMTGQAGATDSFRWLQAAVKSAASIRAAGNLAESDKSLLRSALKRQAGISENGLNRFDESSLGQIGSVSFKG